MFLTSISLSYFFLGITLIALGFLFYFKVLVIKTDPEKSSRKNIIGKMKDPDSWRARNNKMAYVSLFWAIISLAIFIYLKFFFTAGLISIIYLIAYIALVVISTSLFGVRRKSKA